MTESQKRPRRLTRERYEQSADWLDHWPRRWALFGPRVMPVATYLEAMAHADHAKSKLLNVARSKSANFENHCSKLERNAKKTQDYIQLVTRS